MTGTPDIASSSPSDRVPDGRHQTIDVIRSEERLQVGAAVRVSGRAVLRRYVITETVTESFQVRREEVRIDHEPATGMDNTGVDGPAFDGRVIEVVLHREVPMIQMQVVATERVSLHVDTITEQVDVSDHVRRERLDVDTAQD